MAVLPPKDCEDGDYMSTWYERMSMADKAMQHLTYHIKA